MKTTNTEKTEKITVYEAEDTNDGSCVFLNLDDAIEFLRLNITELPEGDLEEMAEEGFELKLKIYSMTREEIAAMPEYNP